MVLSITTENVTQIQTVWASERPKIKSTRYIPIPCAFLVFAQYKANNEWTNILYFHQETKHPKKEKKNQTRLLVGHYFFFFFHYFLHTFTPQLLDRPWSQVLSLLPPGACLRSSTVIAHRVQQSHCSSTVYRVLLTHALALSANQFVHRKKTPRFYTSTCTRGYSKSRNWPIPRSRITWYATEATVDYYTTLSTSNEIHHSLLFPFDKTIDMYVPPLTCCLFFVSSLTFWSILDLIELTQQVGRPDLWGGVLFA